MPQAPNILSDTLPVEDIVAPLRHALASGVSAVVIAPPGAGKTTRLPLALRDAPWLGDRKIIVLEPRRIAARAAAARMAATLGEQIGDTVGLRVRLESRVGPRTRIEVVTEGVFARMILDDPELKDVGCVLFDEFHERSLDADFGLALALDVQGALRDDLRLVVMSATLDGGRAAALLGGDGPPAPVLESPGRSYPVETRWLGRRDVPLEQDIAEAVIRALRAHAGSVLVFLPGQGEIMRAQRLLVERMASFAGGGSIDVTPLYGALPPAAQDQAVAPAAAGRRKVVLATSVAETSITIAGVSVVIDSGLSRVPRYEPAVGMTRLETVRASKAEADQRRGRAGRTAPGVCYRLWAEAADAALAPFAKPEILNADLAPLLLDCAMWGVADPATLAFTDPPPRPALNEAGAFLRDLGALDADGHITPVGRALNALPLSPRLARMVLAATAAGAGQNAAVIAALIGERGAGGDSIDLAERLERFRRDRSPRTDALRRMADGWVKQAERVLRDRATRAAFAALLPLPIDVASSPGAPPSRGAPPSAGVLLALAWPDRIARARAPGADRDRLFHMANGRGVRLDGGGALAKAQWLCIADAMGAAASARIMLAASLELDEVLLVAGARVEERRLVTFDRETASVRVRVQRRLGSLVLAETTAAATTQDDCAGALARGLAVVGLGVLPWSKPLQQWRERVMFMGRAAGDDDRWPDLSDAALLAGDWLAPCLEGRTSLSQLGADDVSNALRALLPWDLQRELDSSAPTHFQTPAGTRVAIDYSSEDGPALAVKVQELFGLGVHPALAGGRTPLALHLLSPAQRPIQITRDLPGFWRGSWRDVRADMRGRYPRHFWPEDPASAPATRRAGRPPGQ